MEDADKIQATAFVTATYRASNEALSKDSYATYWNNPETDQWVRKFVKQVSIEEPFVHCLRNRFFYETIKEFIRKNEIEVLINIGCGFSMYPFLFDDRLINIEVDHKDLLVYKKDQIQKLIQAGKLPKREIHYIAKDFNIQKEELVQEIKSIIGDKPSFVLLEGVIFFLNKTVTNQLIETIGRIQAKGSYFGSVSFLDRSIPTEPFQRLIRFFEREVILDKKIDYLTLPTAYYESLPNYELIKHEDYVSLSKEYSPEKAIENGDLILNENMYILRKQ